MHDIQYNTIYMYNKYYIAKTMKLQTLQTAKRHEEEKERKLRIQSREARGNLLTSYNS